MDELQLTYLVDQYPASSIFDKVLLYTRLVL